MDNYILKSRYGEDSLSVTKIDNETLEIKVLNDLPISVGTEPKTQEILYIDPCGGPMLWCGGKICGNDVLQIDYNDETKSFFLKIK